VNHTEAARISFNVLAKIYWTQLHYYTIKVDGNKDEIPLANICLPEV